MASPAAGQEYDPTNNYESSDEQVDQTVPNSHVQGDAEEEQEEDNDGSEDGGDYDPESISFDPPAQVPEKSATPPQQSSKPKTSGGFIIEASDDDEEDEEEEEEQEDDDAPQDSAVPEQTEQQQNAPAQRPVTVAAPTDTPVEVPPMMGGIDPTALLEARVKEDPRGDMDAWLNLMAEYRRRSNLDSLRDVYNRFVEVFPQAVSAYIYCRYPTTLTHSRRISGLNGSRWSLAWINSLKQNSSLADVL